MEDIILANQDAHIIEVPYRVKYTNQKPVPVDVLVESLLGYERILKRCAPFLTKACNDATIVDIEVFVNKIEPGSIWEDFLVRVIFKDQETYAKAIEVAGTVTENNSVIKTALCLGVGAMIGYGISNSFVNKGQTTQPAPITYYNSIVADNGATINISPEEQKKILGGIRDKKRLSEEAISVLSPAQQENGAMIEIEGLPEINIPADFVKASPKKYETPEKTVDERVIRETEIEIFASDRDKPHNWAGIVTGHIDHRIKFILNDALDPAKIHGTTRANADIIITSQLDPNKKEWKDVKVEIVKIYSYPKDEILDDQPTEE